MHKTIINISMSIIPLALFISDVRMYTILNLCL